MDVKTRRLTTTAVTAALVYVVTILLVIQIPAVKGAYFNLGDVIIYCSAFILGGPYAAGPLQLEAALPTSPLVPRYIFRRQLLSKPAWRSLSGLSRKK